MTDEAFQVPLLFEYVATFSWAVSGALVAIRKHFDVTGVFVIAMLSSSGGGLIRDAIFLQQTPIFLLEPFLPAARRRDDADHGGVHTKSHPGDL